MWRRRARPGPWGANSLGQLGDGTTTNRDVPAEIDPGEQHGWAEIGAGWYYACGIREDGTLWCWGNNEFGQVGDGTTTDRITPIAVAGLWDEISAGGSHTCRIRIDNTLWCWGHNDVGQLGDGTTAQRTTPTQVGAGAGNLWMFVDTGDSHTAAIDF